MRPDQDAVNQATFDSATVLAEYESGWSDLGERKLFGHLAERARGRRVLDLGIGTGRTTRLFLRRVSEDYVGLDLSPTGVRTARERFPEVDLRLADARDLGEFADGEFGLVHFSYNGIDLVDHEGRERVLDEMVRVCADDGLVSYSTFNLDSFYARARPWLLDAEGHRLTWRPAGLVPWLRGAPSQAGRYARTWRSWWRIRDGGTEGGDWAVRPLQIHEFGLLAHYENQRGLRTELSAHGLEPERAIAPSGDEVDLARDHGDQPYTHVVAHKVLAGGAR